MLTDIKSGSFPLRQSLFWKDGNTLDSTWNFFARNRDDAWRLRCATWLSARNINTLIFLAFNRDPECPVNPFTGGFASNVDYTELAKWDYWLKMGKNGGCNLIPCLYCDGDTQTAKGDDSLHQYYLDLAIPYFAQYCRGLLLGLEMTECFLIPKIEAMIAYAKIVRARHGIKPEDFPISVHVQWSKGDTVIKGQEWGCLEHDWDPHKGGDHSPEEVTQGIADYINASGLVVAAVEYNLILDEHHRQQSLAAAKTPGCIMVGGPL